MKRFHRLLCAAAVLVCAHAQAQDRPYDPKALARYDVSYAHCEKTFPEMKGHRDEAYLSLWRAEPNEKTNKRLADARAAEPYKTEKKRAARSAAQASSPEAVKTLEQECRGLWGEMAKMPKHKS
jgi:hypothetical protein